MKTALVNAWADPGFILGGLKDEFIRMSTDCIAVKTQLLW